MRRPCCGTPARDFGPDLPCRIISEAANIEIAMLGKVALGARSPGEALMRIVAALPYYCSHEEVSVERKPGRYIVREFFAHKFDPETRHLLLQYAAAMIDRVLGMAGDPPPRFARMEIPPHPTCGVRHLRPWFGDNVVEGRSRGLAVVVDERIMHRPFGSVARSRLGPRALVDAEPLRGDGTLSGSVRTFLQLMIEADQTPTLSRVVAAAGTSKRSLQRQLEAEGTNFSEAAGRHAPQRNAEPPERPQQNDRFHRRGPWLFRSGVIHPRIPSLDRHPSRPVSREVGVKSEFCSGSNIPVWSTNVESEFPPNLRRPEIVPRGKIPLALLAISLIHLRLRALLLPQCFHGRT